MSDLCTCGLPPRQADHSGRHFHSTNDVIYVTLRDATAGLKLRIYIVMKGGALEEYIMPPLSEEEDDGGSRTTSEADESSDSARRP